MTIDVIISGSGVHRFFGTNTPCKAGEIYILPENVPHGYVVSEKGEELSIRGISFPAQEWLHGEVSDPGYERYCYGGPGWNDGCLRGPDTSAKRRSTRTHGSDRD